MRISEKGVLINYHDDPDITQLVIPPEVKKIAPDAFYGSEYLEEVVISKGVEEISTSAFRGSHELRSVIMPDSVRVLGRSAFRECRRLKEIRLSAGLHEIPADCFNGCHSLESVYVPDGVRTIGLNAFNCCTGLTSVRLPDGLSSIDTGAFMETFSLRSITIPDGVTSIDSYTFFRSGIERVSYMGMEICLDRISNENGVFELSFSETLSEWLGNGGGKTNAPQKELRAPFLMAYFASTRSKPAGEYVKKNFSKLFSSAIRANNIPAVKAVIEEGGFLSSRNIGRYIDLASECGRHEIYLMLLDCKNRQGAYGKTGADRFRL